MCIQAIGACVLLIVSEAASDIDLVFFCALSREAWLLQPGVMLFFIKRFSPRATLVSWEFLFPSCDEVCSMYIDRTEQWLVHCPVSLSNFSPFHSSWVNSTHSWPLEYKGGLIVLGESNSPNRSSQPHRKCNLPWSPLSSLHWLSQPGLIQLSCLLHVSRC